ncbi:MAG TPA: condensation domain-containing protein, partial [Ktedonobacteraceae bacterium]|nr:condensation domain-containing protein [Ktedonobacteraceae bacterium]
MQNTIEGFRLSPQQERLWLLQQDNDVYHAHCSILLEGDLDVEALKEAVSEVICRNEMYRTCFYRLPGLKMPIQVINEEQPFSWRHIDLSCHSPQEREVRVAEIFQEEKQRPIDLQHGPLVYFAFITLSERNHVLFVHLHSLHADNCTLRNIVRDIAHLYERDLVADDPPEEVVQYVQFSEWQNALLEEEDGTVGREYWRKKDIAALSSWCLPLEGKPGKDAGFAPDSFALPINPVIQAKLKDVVAKYDTTTALFFLACWQVLLWRLTERSEFLIGMAVDGRVFEELAETAGPLAKYIPVSCQLNENQDFLEILAQTRQATDEAFEWQQYFTWEDMGQTHEIPAGSLCLPFCFDCSEQPITYSAAGVSFSLQTCHTCQEPFKVKVSVVQKSDALMVEFHYDTSLFSLKDIQRLAGQFHILLEHAVNRPKALMSELEILCECEREQLLIKFNSTDA